MQVTQQLACHAIQCCHNGQWQLPMSVRRTIHKPCVLQWFRVIEPIVDRCIILPIKLEFNGLKGVHILPGKQSGCQCSWHANSTQSHSWHCVWWPMMIILVSILTSSKLPTIHLDREGTWYRVGMLFTLRQTRQRRKENAWNMVHNSRFWIERNTNQLYTDQLHTWNTITSTIQKGFALLHHQHLKIMLPTVAILFFSVYYNNWTNTSKWTLKWRTFRSLLLSTARQSNKRYQKPSKRLTNKLSA